MDVGFAYIIGKIATIVSGLAGVARSVEHIAENKEIKNRVPELATQMRELRKKLEGFVVSFDGLTEQLERYEHDANARLTSVERRVKKLTLIAYVLSITSGALVVYVILHIANLIH
jgi:hypothetical protein